MLHIALIHTLPHSKTPLTHYKRNIRIPGTAFWHAQVGSLVLWAQRYNFKRITKGITVFFSCSYSCLPKCPPSKPLLSRYHWYHTQCLPIRWRTLPFFCGDLPFLRGDVPFSPLRGVPGPVKWQEKDCWDWTTTCKWGHLHRLWKA